MMITMTNTPTITANVLFLDQNQHLTASDMEELSYEYADCQFDHLSALPRIDNHYDFIVVLAHSHDRSTVRRLHALIESEVHTNIIVASVEDNPASLFPYINNNIQGFMSLRYFKENATFVFRHMKEQALFLEPAYHSVLILEIERIKLREQPIKKLILQKEIVQEILSENEQNVLQLLLEGNNNLQIAQSLYLAPSTISTIISHLLKKMNANDRTDALVKSIRNGWVDAYR
ncbi:response regulator transcription factor [Bacillus sp. H-16]|uniref:response regulator transcription factor n=1 Tax=Alteribacter salitolerans TaxID=2912333 RepID=UPI001963EB13|nr:LuxR C-terminal-related transcriptional regulator [Alteribacter salitolerans]MBM7096851.1 response regulator transcription factor [Alteribacter salitolerans]